MIFIWTGDGGGGGVVVPVPVLGTLVDTGLVLLLEPVGAGVVALFICHLARTDL